MKPENAENEMKVSLGTKPPNDKAEGVFIICFHGPQAEFT
jgi:hypothetical protein